MKHLKPFEYSLNHNFNTGDLVKCIEEPYDKEIKLNNAYIIDSITLDDKVFLTHISEHPFFLYRFIKISKDEYDMLKNINNYNL